MLNIMKYCMGGTKAVEHPETIQKKPPKSAELAISHCQNSRDSIDKRTLDTECRAGVWEKQEKITWNAERE